MPSLDLSSPEVHITPKLVQAADMRINTTDLGYTANALIDGAYASDYYLDGDKIDLTIIGREIATPSTNAGRQALPIATPIGQLVPLSAVADVKLSSGPEQINHRERERAITIQVTPPADDAAGRRDGSRSRPDRAADRRVAASSRAAITSTWPARPTSSAKPGRRCGSTSCWPASSPTC